MTVTATAYIDKDGVFYIYGEDKVVHSNVELPTLIPVNKSDAPREEKIEDIGHFVIPIEKLIDRVKHSSLKAAIKNFTK